MLHLPSDVHEESGGGGGGGVPFSEVVREK